MPISPAPFFNDLADGAPEGEAHWVKTSDGIRIRVGHWRGETPERGTVLMFPGRTEYIEKYSDAAREMTSRGFAMLAIDWRGQGLADRLLEDRQIGHVEHFPDFQKDIAAALRVARELELPRPFYLLAHSMGGAIGLRAVMEGLPVQACAFTAPMWGIYMPSWQRLAATATAYLGPMLGLGNRMMPSTEYESYVLIQEFEGNLLTTDPDMHQMLQNHLQAHPELGLGGPSIRWMREALNEGRTLAARASPDIPCLTFLGSLEGIVDSKAIEQRMNNWPRGELAAVDAARHELMIETPTIRTHVFDRIDKLFGGTHETGTPSS
jgi:lysophospholipase